MIFLLFFLFSFKRKKFSLKMPAPKKGAGERPRIQKKKEGNQYHGGDATYKITCFNCGKPGHRKSECRAPPKAQTPRENNRNRNDDRRVSNGKDPPRGTARGNSQPRKSALKKKPESTRSNSAASRVSSERPRTKIRCYNCGKNGHAAKDCDAPRKECSECGRLGHLAADCRKVTDGTNNVQQGKKDTGTVRGRGKVCFNCAGTDHIASQCTNPKSVRAPQLPWPQKTWISKDISAISRVKVKNWSHEELVEIKEFNRLIELSVDISVCKTKLECKVQECDTTQQTVTHWNRVANTKTEIKAPASVAQETLLRMQISEFEKDKALCLIQLESQQTKIMKKAIDQAIEHQKFFVQHQRDEPDSVRDFLIAAKTSLESDDGIKLRIEQVITWMNRMYAEMHHVIKIEIAKTREQHVLRKATKDAAQRVKQIAASGTFVDESEDARAKRARELVETAVARVVSQDLGASAPRE